ncbi:MAG: TRAP transporter small permease subunit [Rhodobacteraceae bacterium]|nr:TRAP transporter small permease subunit [Paracoccaceae bacterium]
MSDSHVAADVQKTGTSAPLIRSFGWAILGALAAFLANNVLVVGYGFPQAGLATLAIGIVGIGIAIIFAIVTRETSLRWDAMRIHRFNVYLIRACFWVVLLVGITDSTIALMRVEKLFDPFFSQEMVRNFNLSSFVGMYIHIPLVIAGFVIALFTRTLGFTWLALLIVLAELFIVISRFVFSYEQALMGDLVRYWYAALFLFASAYTLFEEGHVRVDVLYAGFNDRKRGFVNALGTLLLGASTCMVILWIGINGKQSIINAPVMNFEITQTGGVGMFVKYQMAVFLGIFATTMLIQFVSYFFEAVADFRSEPGHRTVEPAGH